MMKFFVKTDRPVDEWFRDPTRRASSLNSIARLESLAILLISEAQKRDCDLIITSGKSRFLSEDLCRISNSAIVVADSKIPDTNVIEIGPASDPDGVIPEGTSDARFDAHFERINSIEIDDFAMEDAAQAFLRIFGAHLKLAGRLVIIDPYAASNLFNKKSEFAKILAQVILPNPDLEIVIHTTIDHGFFADENQLPNKERPVHDVEWFNRAKESLAQSIQDLANASDARNKGLNLKLYRYSRQSRNTMVRFPHDRHFEFQFGESAGGLSVSDCFALGNGLDLFSDTEYGTVASRGSDVYVSTVSKMWRNFKPDYHQKLLSDGYIPVLPEWFGAGDGKQVQYFQPERRAR